MTALRDVRELVNTFPGVICATPQSDERNRFCSSSSVDASVGCGIVFIVPVKLAALFVLEAVSCRVSAAATRATGYTREFPHVAAFVGMVRKTELNRMVQ